MLTHPDNLLSSFPDNPEIVERSLEEFEYLVDASTDGLSPHLRTLRLTVSYPLLVLRTTHHQDYRRSEKHYLNYNDENAWGPQASPTTPRLYSSPPHIHRCKTGEYIRPPTIDFLPQLTHGVVLRSHIHLHREDYIPTCYRHTPTKNYYLSRATRSKTTCLSDYM